MSADCRLHDRRIGGPERGSVQTGSGADPASNLMGTAGSFLAGKVTGATHLYPVPNLWLCVAVHQLQQVYHIYFQR